jgi:MFS family permease
MLGFVLFIFILSFPETLFSRTEFSNLENRSYWQRLMFRGKVIQRPLHLSDFLNNFKMLRYWSIILPCIYYMTANTYGSLLFVLTTSSIAEKHYHFNTGQIGLLIGVPLSIGCLIGESFTGWVSDWLAVRYAKRHDGYYKAEVRLWLAPLALFLPIGLIMHGVCVQTKQPWISLAIAEAVASIGVQAGTTMTYSYCSDCYKPQAAEVSTIINLFRFVFAFTVGFYALPFSAEIGFGSAWGTLAAVNFVTWLLLCMLIFKGESIRGRQGEPDLHKDL